MSTKTRTKFRHDDALERDFTLARTPYEGVNLSTCNVVPQRVASVEQMARPTLGDMFVAVHDDRFFGLGITGRDLVCAHEVRIVDRMGHGRCSKCHGHLFCASWVADGWMGDATVEFANAEAARMAVRCDESEARFASQARVSLNVVPPAQEPLFYA
jgi:hypothetical protein